MVIGTIGRAIEWQKWLELPEGPSSLLLREHEGGTGDRKSTITKVSGLNRKESSIRLGVGKFDFRKILRIRPEGSLSHVQAPVGFDHPRDLAGSSRHPGIGTLPLIPRDSGPFRARQMRRHFSWGRPRQPSIPCPHSLSRWPPVPPADDFFPVFY